jgi:predicted amidohydrolase
MVKKRRIIVGKVKVLGIQITCNQDKKGMMKKALQLIDEASSIYGGFDVICLPELWYQSPANQVEGESLGEELDDVFCTTFKEVAQRYKVNIITGSFLEKKCDKLYNTALVINREGNVVGKYSKIHMFDAFDIKESDFNQPGNELCLIDLDIGKIGVVICYDLRFPEMLRNMASKGMDILFAPAAFFMPRYDHWDILARSAAVQTVSYTVAVNQIGTIGKVGFVGRSQILNPSGITIAGVGDVESYFVGHIDLVEQKVIRERTPVISHRRLEFYY